MDLSCVSSQKRFKIGFRNKTKIIYKLRIKLINNRIPNLPDQNIIIIVLFENHNRAVMKLCLLWQNFQTHSFGIIIEELKPFYQVIIFENLNRYRRGLEICPQAKTLKRERSATRLFSSLFLRRVRATSMTQRRVENTRVHFWTFSPVSVKIENEGQKMKSN